MPAKVFAHIFAHIVIPLDLLIRRRPFRLIFRFFPRGFIPWEPKQGKATYHAVLVSALQTHVGNLFPNIIVVQLIF